MASPPPFDIDDLMGHADALYAFAMTRMRDHHHAQELVQDTLVAAWKKRDGFDGRSALRTWLIGILRHKILDFHRSSARTPTLQAASRTPGDNPDERDPLDLLFDARGSWKVDPNAGLDFLAEAPTEAIHRSDILEWLRHCIAELPARWRVLFTARELDHAEMAEAAALAEVKTTSAPVLLTRARHQLRACLQSFGIRPR